MMDWTQLIISSVSGIIGTAVGGFLTYKTMSKQFQFMEDAELKKQKREDECHWRSKREETYLEAIEIITNTMLITDFSQWFKSISSVVAKVALYLPQDDLNLFMKLIQTTKEQGQIDENMIDEFVKHCKDELGIKI